MDAMIIQTIAVYAIPVILAITLHEAAHAYAAKFFGDTTAYSQGRMSLNPIVHIDLFGTIIIPIVLYLATDGQFLFGYAKPVPINFGALRKPKRDMAWVALAGPGANFIMAFLWMILAVLLLAFKVEHEFFYRMAQAGLLTNLVMFAFNLFPIPPLDGGRILTSLLPHRQAYQFAKIEPYGFFIVMALVYLKILQFWMYPLMNIAQYVLQLVLTPFTMLLK
ncbi:site-2 protease family protein [Undibacterium sp. Ji22W]|uniref:site-2 protease family protein n=1 Tax=Undibacterium sp. Ji22W TaxID=3413038 RepID=UPI003BF14DAC